MQGQGTGADTPISKPVSWALAGDRLHTKQVARSLMSQLYGDALKRARGP